MGNGDLHAEAPSPEYDMVLRLERLRLREALNARDVAVARLEEACVSVREKSAALDTVREEKLQLQKQLDASKENSNGVGLLPRSTAVGKLSKHADFIKPLDVRFGSLTVSDEAGGWKEHIDGGSKEVNASNDSTPSRVFRTMYPTNIGVPILRDVPNPIVNAPVPSSSPLAPYVVPNVDTPESPWTPFEGERRVELPTISTAEKIDTRYAILASLPLPSDIPEDSLTPILIPPPHTLHDFIGTTSGLLRSQLGNYRIFQQSTTTWCPEREEHGYYLTPVFKCSTNPRVTTAHRWSSVDFAPILNHPTECFYNKDGKWYYAGIYKFFRLEDLCTQEWECLSTETSQALIKETLAARKNTSPQNIYETSQLYSAGALKVACIGLQCIGFNNTLYRSLLEHAALCTQTGKWRAPAGGFTSAGLGLSPGPGPSPSHGSGPSHGHAATWSPNLNPGVHGPGSPVAQSSAGNVGVIGRPSSSGAGAGAGLVPGFGFGSTLGQLPSPNVLLLQRGTQDVSMISGEGAMT